MIILDNYSKKNTYISITEEGYSIIDANSTNDIENGEGGFSEDNELLGIYVQNNKFYFQYNSNKYQTNINEIVCTNEQLQDNTRNFKVKIREIIVCDIMYKPYLSPLSLILEGEDDEFDFLLYLSRILKNEESIIKFVKGINNLNLYYSKTQRD